MSEYLGSREEKQKVLKNIIKGLHEGKSVDEVKAEFQHLIKDVDASEIASMEQALIAEGMPPEHITKLCDVHAAFFREPTEANEREDKLPGHPAHLMTYENQELSNELERVAGLMAAGGSEFSQALSGLLASLDKLYARKENIIFPYLERHGITGPPSVMWSVDDEIRDRLKRLISRLQEAREPAIKADWTEFVRSAKEMVFKEENILIPMLLDTLTEDEWLAVKEQFYEYGPVFSWPHGEFWQPEIGGKSKEEPIIGDGLIELDTGSLSRDEINNLLVNLPIDITLVDKNDVVRYFSASSERLFVRTKSIIGRRVQNCHPPDSVHVVEKILSDFKSGKHNQANFWLQMQGKFIYIRYLALRSPEGEYLGTMEVSQDVTAIRQLSGDRRLLTYDQ